MSSPIERRPALPVSALASPPGSSATRELEQAASERTTRAVRHKSRQDLCRTPLPRGAASPRGTRIGSSGAPPPMNRCKFGMGPHPRGASGAVDRCSSSEQQSLPELPPGSTRLDLGGFSPHSVGTSQSWLRLLQGLVVCTWNKKSARPGKQGNRELSKTAQVEASAVRHKSRQDLCRTPLPRGAASLRGTRIGSSGAPPPPHRSKFGMGRRGASGAVARCPSSEQQSLPELLPGGTK